MNWKEAYKKKIVTAEEAMRVVKTGDRVVPGDFCAEPVHLIEALVKRAKELNGIEVAHGGNIGPEPHLDPGMEKYIHFNCLCAVPKSRKALEEQRADYTPCYFHQWPRLFAPDGPLPVDVALIQLTPPDENGDCSFGVSVDFTSYLPEFAKITIAQINSNMPRTFSKKINLNQLDWIVPYDEPLVELGSVPAGELEAAISKHVAPLVCDGAAVQIGIGKLPDLIMHSLREKNDLGIHTEMMSNGVMELMKLGVVTNKYKAVHPGKTVTSFLGGDREFYRWVDNNPDIELLPVDFVNDPYVIGQNPNVISINSAIEVDLTGQIVADTIGTRQFTGVGGFNDFVRGARRSKGGKTIVTFPSATGNGKHSRIVPFITPGAAVCATRFDADYIVTEYGVAQLWGKTTRQRIEALIAIAHPSFRDELCDYARKNKLLW